MLTLREPSVVLVVQAARFGGVKWSACPTQAKVSPREGPSATLQPILHRASGEPELRPLG